MPIETIAFSRICSRRTPAITLQAMRLPAMKLLALKRPAMKLLAMKVLALKRLVMRFPTIAPVAIAPSQ